MPYLEMGDESIYYDHKGTDGDPGILLIHGSGGDHTHWPADLRELSGFNVHAVDLPGHGKSTGQGRKTVDDYADFIDLFVRRKGLSNVTLFGHSLGGAIVQILALRSPDWLSRIVLVGTGARLRVAPAILSGVLADFGKTCEMVMKWSYGPGVSEALVAQGRGVISRCRPETVFGDFNACDRFDIMERVHEISIPALIVSADSDKLTPLPYGKYLSETIPGARFAAIKGCGHMMALEEPGQFISCVRAFLDAPAISG